MLWGPPETLTKRTVVPGAIVIAVGTNVAWVLPLPVIVTSTTGPAGWVAAGCAAEVWVCVWSAFFSPPHARAPRASSAPKAVNRIAALLRGNVCGISVCERVHNMKGPSSKREGPHVRPGFKAIKPLIYLKKHRNWARLHRGFPASFRPFSGAPMSNKETGGFTVQRFIVVLGLALLAATSVQAQRGSWQSEIGVQGGFSRFKPAGSGAKDAID